jgi:hypothetical protein
MMILPKSSVERLAVRPVVTTTPRTLPEGPRNTGIVPPWLINGHQVVAGVTALENTGIVPPWMLSGSPAIPTLIPGKV